jgi:hypothetical protein
VEQAILKYYTRDEDNTKSKDQNSKLGSYGAKGNNPPYFGKMKPLPEDYYETAAKKSNDNFDPWRSKGRQNEELHYGKQEPHKPHEETFDSSKSRQHEDNHFKAKVPEDNYYDKPRGRQDEGYPIPKGFEYFPISL